ncbi:phosphatase PAP2 family protein [Bradyrhizobium genosp. SA-3]|uniref:phosphatase PAP2 family protein n=1 Tax=Bradyrhizobium genosp. SA-3 TaxID=508868 RepID=UPI0013EE8513|nr:phosphatase PAP2 family protein [Bradyrhizobium genosp. SA-3]
MRLLDAFQLGPLLTFPSFHAVSAVLYMWVLWPIRWVRGIGVLWNGVMLAATPIGGGHYFVDVFAGVVVAIASIWAIKRIGALLAPEQDRESSISQISTVDPFAMVEPDGDLSPQSS